MSENSSFPRRNPPLIGRQETNNAKNVFYSYFEGSVYFPVRSTILVAKHSRSMSIVVFRTMKGDILEQSA
jgi:type IV secretory pathway VirB4 component